jgi:hypothetical protein
MNADDLGTLLRSRPIDEPPLPTVNETIARVRRAVSVARLRIGVTVVAAIAVIAGVVTAGATPWHRASTDFTNRTVDGFPEYSPGYRVAATADSPKSGVVTMRTTNEMGWLLISIRCPTVSPQNYVFADIAINGVPNSGFNCDRESGNAKPSGSNLNGTGILAGNSFTVTVRLARAEESGMTGPAGELTEVPFSVAIYQPVPFSEVPLPRRPARLAPLHLNDQGEIYRSDPADPSRPIRFTTTWHACGHNVIGCLVPVLVSTTPGEFVVTINGRRSGIFIVYDYLTHPAFTQAETRDTTLTTSLSEGAALNVVVTPRYATGPWAVQTLGTD